MRFPDATKSRISSLLGNVKQNLAPRGGLSTAQVGKTEEPSVDKNPVQASRHWKRPRRKRGRLQN